MGEILIGKLASETGCNIETIRYYERIGLLPEPPRSAGGQRLYGEEDTKRLIFVRRSRELGFPREDVRNLLNYVEGGDYTCTEIREITVDHLGEVRRKIKDLRQLERALKEMVVTCDGGDIPDCPILDALGA